MACSCNILCTALTELESSKWFRIPRTDVPAIHSEHLNDPDCMLCYKIVRIGNIFKIRINVGPVIMV